jgi:hypothetical protein
MATLMQITKSGAFCAHARPHSLACAHHSSCSPWRLLVRGHTPRCAAAAAGPGSPEELQPSSCTPQHPEALQHCDETAEWNYQNLSSLNRRIEQVPELTQLAVLPQLHHQPQ